MCRREGWTLVWVTNELPSITRKGKENQWEGLGEGGDSRGWKVCQRNCSSGLCWSKWCPSSLSDSGKPRSLFAGTLAEVSWGQLCLILKGERPYFSKTSQGVFVLRVWVVFCQSCLDWPVTVILQWLPLSFPLQPLLWQWFNSVYCFTKVLTFSWSEDYLCMLFNPKLSLSFTKIVFTPFKWYWLQPAQFSVFSSLIVTILVFTLLTRKIG